MPIEERKRLIMKKKIGKGLNMIGKEVCGLESPGLLVGGFGLTQYPTAGKP